MSLLASLFPMQFRIIFSSYKFLSFDAFRANAGVIASDFDARVPLLDKRFKLQCKWPKYLPQDNGTSCHSFSMSPMVEYGVIILYYIVKIVMSSCRCGAGLCQGC